MRTRGVMVSFKGVAYTSEYGIACFLAMYGNGDVALALTEALTQEITAFIVCLAYLVW